MYDTTITLKKPVITYDDYGNEIKTFTDREIYAMYRSVYQSEFYNAAQIGLHPSITFIITNREDYEDEKTVGHEGKIYTVIRADWNAQKDSISLVCEERIGLNG